MGNYKIKCTLCLCTGNLCYSRQTIQGPACFCFIPFLFLIFNAFSELILSLLGTSLLLCALEYLIPHHTVKFATLILRGPHSAPSLKNQARRMSQNHLSAALCHTKVKQLVPIFFSPDNFSKIDHPSASLKTSILRFQL